MPGEPAATDPAEKEARPATSQRLWTIGPALVLAYIVLVHTVDTLATHRIQFGIDWSVFRWRTAIGFDLLKFLGWLIIPLILIHRHLDRGYFTFQRWKTLDFGILAGLMAAGVAAISLIGFVPTLRETYPSLGAAPLSLKLTEGLRLLIWTCSWLPGWEFLHRYVLVTSVQAKWPRFGWLLVPLIEGAYHVQKPWPETLGMVLFSVVATRWTMTRRNVLLPFLAHLIIELELILFLIVL